MSTEPLRILVMVSGGGSNLQALIDASKSGHLTQGAIIGVLSSRQEAYGLHRARQHEIPSQVVERSAYASDELFDQALLDTMNSFKPDLVCLAGFMRKLSPAIVRKYPGRILNIHPALLPQYGGPGMYGRHVHEAVLAAGEKISGCSVHLVDEELDHGAVLAQARVPVQPGDSIETLAKRVLEQEHRLYPRVVQDYCAQLISTENQK